jgi:S1-C subfamily serine protease
MLNHRLGGAIGVGLATTLLATGCAQHAELPSVQEHPPFVAETNIATPMTLADIYMNVVEVRVPEVGLGTGTVVNVGETRLVVTAGHVVSAPNTCSDTQIVYRPTSGTHLTALAGGQNEIQHTAGERYRFQTYNNGSDMAVIEPRDSHAFAGLTGVDLLEHPDPQPGEPVFMVGYGPRAGMDRAPDAADLAQTLPTAVGGLILGRSDENPRTYVVLTSIDDKANTANPGDSGGPVFDAQGRYVGETIASNYLPSDTREIEAAYGVDLPDGQTSYTVSLFQLVDRATVAALAQQVRPCTG